jgi:hypothetical protein
MEPGPIMIAMLAGDVGEWVFGIGTVAALVWAILETRRARASAVKAHDQTERALAMQEARDRNDADIRQRAQAALVACSIEVAPLNVKYTIWNYSVAPIFELWWFVVTGVRTVHSAGPDETKTLGRGEPPHETTCVISLDLARQLDRLTGISFRDNAGVDWVKWTDGRLELRAPDGRGAVDDFTNQIAGETTWARGQHGAE